MAINRGREEPLVFYEMTGALLGIRHVGLPLLVDGGGVTVREVTEEGATAACERALLAGGQIKIWACA